MANTRDSDDQGDTTAETPPSHQIMDILGLRTSVPAPPAAGKKSGKPAPYLRGPIPWTWLRTAYQESPGCLLVGLGLWHFRSLNKNMTFPLSMKRLADFLGISRRTVQRAVAAMIELGLIKIQFQFGARHIYTLIIGD